MAVIQFIGDRFTGLSTDTKPSGVLLGAMFTETDTGKVFVHNGTSWTEAPYLSTINWGDIGGTLTNQTDLNNALAGKASTNHMQTAQYGGLGVDASGWATGKVPKFNSVSGKFEPTDVIIDLGLNTQVSGPILINEYGDLLETNWDIFNQNGQHMLAYNGNLGMFSLVYSDPEAYISGSAGFMINLEDASGTLAEITSGIAAEQASYFSNTYGPATTFLYQNASDGHLSSIILEDELLSLTVNSHTVTLDGDGEFKVNGSAVWHAGNDGHNSGLDADTLDGKHAVDFSPSLIKVSVPTARTTQAKVGSTTGGSYTPQKGDFILVEFDHGIAATGATLNIDGSGAKNIRIGTSNISTSMVNIQDANVLVPMYYDGSYYQMYGWNRADWTIISENEIDIGSATTKRYINAQRANYMIQRSNHQGTQAISTVTGLQNALDGKASTTHMQTAQYGGLGVDASSWSTGKVPKFNSTSGKFEPTDIVVDLGLNDQVSGPILINDYGDLLETGWNITRSSGLDYLEREGDFGEFLVMYGDPDTHTPGMGAIFFQLHDVGNYNDISAGFMVGHDLPFTGDFGSALVYQNNDSGHASILLLEDGMTSIIADTATLEIHHDGTFEFNQNTIWHAGNDGHTSGLDADTVDGKHATDFALASHNHDTSHITTGTFADARIKESNVTQHEGALSIAAGQITGLATVATTGKYGDLTDKPDLSALAEIEQHDKFDDFPNTGESHKVYIAIDTGYMYRWNGTGYTQLTDQTAIWGQITGTMSDQTDLNNALSSKADATTVSNHISDTTNPHAVTLVQLGDTTISSPSNRHALIYSSGKWINRSITEADISDLGSYITGVSWGDIGGTLSNQTDLNSALAGKANTNHMQTAQYGGLGVDASGWTNNRVPKFNATSGKFEPIDPTSLINVPGAVGQVLTSDGVGGLDISSWYWANSTLGSEDVEGALYPLGGLSYAGVIIHDETGMALASKIDNTNYSYVLSEIDESGSTRNIIKSLHSTLAGSSHTTIDISPTGLNAYIFGGFESNELILTNAEFTINSNKIWHAGNDGHGSGLDADTLDGKHATEFALVTDALTEDNLADESGPLFIPYRKSFGAHPSQASLIARKSVNTRGTMAVDLQINGTADQIASGNYSSILGGTGNTASGQYSTVVGGNQNIASALYSTALGGQMNEATAQYTLVAGRFAYATHNGSMVFADGSGGANKYSEDDNTFNLWFSGGLFLNGQEITPGGGGAAWGDITGTLSNQTDLQNALNSKLESSDLVQSANAKTTGAIPHLVDSLIANQYALVSSSTGNTRGRDSVDLQTSRTSTDQVSSGQYSAIPGGRSNKASGTYSITSGGYLNSSTASYSSTLGGYNNTASGNYSAALGGYQNTASGQYSLAAGRQAQASHSGSMTLADGVSANTKVSQGINTLNLWFDNGVYLNGTKMEEHVLPKLVTTSSSSNAVTITASEATSGTVYYGTNTTNRTYILGSGPANTQYIVIAMNTGDITFSAGTGQTIKSNVGSSPKITEQYTAVTLIKDTANSWLVLGRIE